VRPREAREAEPISPSASAGSDRGEARLARLTGGLSRLTGWRRLGLLFLAGAVSVLAMPPLFLWPVLLVTLPVLIWSIEPATAPIEGARQGTADRRPVLHLDRQHLLQAALAGWSFAWGFHVAGLYWLREAFMVTGGGLAMLWPLGVVALPAFLALFHGAAAAAAVALPGTGLARVLAFAVALGVTEWLRGNILTGFPWNVLGVALTGSDAMMQSAGVLGIYGLTVVAVIALAGPGVALVAGTTRRPRVLAAALLAVPLAAMLVYGMVRLRAPLPPDVEGIRLRLVQPSVDQREKWRPEKQPEHIERQLALSLRNPSGRTDNLAGITHVIWPEAAMPYWPLARREVLDAIGAALPDGVHLLAGILRAERRTRPAATGVPPREDIAVLNSLAVFDGNGRPVAIYDKTHLVPFGEYLPFPELLEAIGLQSLTRQRGGFTTGPSPRALLDVPGLPGAGPLICYEAVFPGVGRQSAGRPHLLVNVTNDGWFGNSTGPRQHLHQARLRSVEEGVPLMRVANNGITAAFDAFGREIARLELDVAGVIDTPLPGRIAPPPYARFGDLLFALLCALVLAVRSRMQ
jgi:apolipoprotein N-acyltransferase